MKILDNLNTLLGDDLKQSLSNGSKLKIAASYFSIYAYEALKEELEKVESIEFIFTSPSFTPVEATDKLKKEQREFFIPKQKREKDFYGNEFEIQLKNKLNQKAIAQECANWIKRKATFKSNTTNSPMQQFLCIDGEETSAYNPISGFSAVDLGYQKGNAVSNFVNKINDKAMTQIYLNLFDQIWNDEEKIQDVTNSLIEHISTVYKENSPEKIYFLILYNIFNEFLEDLNEDVLPNDLTGFKDTLVWNKLYNFQKDAATGVINKLETFNGCILADSVGLGKTFTALAVVKYYELRNRSVLVLCPKKLADNWLAYNSNLVTNIFTKDRFNYDVLNHTDLQRTSGYSHGIALDKINWANYDLVVIDESHNFRNNNAYKDKETRYQRLMNEIIKKGVKTKVLMLSATPVNNRFTDLKNQLALAYEGNADEINEKLKTTRDIEEIFRRAQATFNWWSNLEAEKRTAEAILNALDFDFFELLDSVTIARSRKHIQTFYDTSDIGTFPKRNKPISFHPKLTELQNTLGFNDIFKELSLLKLCVYAPVSYILPSRVSYYEELYDTEVKGGRGRFKQVDREKSLQSLMTTNLLKRLESSVHSFRLTLEKLKENNELILEKIKLFEQNKVGSKFSDFTNINEDTLDDEDLSNFDDLTVGNKIQIDLSDMDLSSWKYDISSDLEIINALLFEMEKITPEHDFKFQHLKSHIKNKMSNPINKDNKKVLIFTAFADTAMYLYDNLALLYKNDYDINTGLITGSQTPKSTIKDTYDLQGLLTLFSPISKEKKLIFPDEQEEIDIIIATDCISEGQNLQDCDYLINYDIHWNPVRIIQRFGRVDRIGSKNDVIQMVNYWPNISLDEYINLKERVENRMMIADVTATGDDNVLSSKANDISYRKEQLRKLQEEVIEMEDLKTGVNITDLGLNDFRMDLLNYIKENGDLGSLPNGLHAVVNTDYEKGLVPGVIFILLNRDKSVNSKVEGQNRLYPYYLIYIDNEANVIADHTEAKKLLDLARNACKGTIEPIDKAYHTFNQQTNDGKDMSFYSDLLEKAIKSMIDINEDKDIDSLFTGGSTTALVNTIEGLDNFELINFIVVQDI
ncbi:helicase-related protein [Halarcobacter sp.]|uniref:helicase-related protein n=1 Tax=Halarcobacter sp. TaxID=2321133 RepID=UPI0029F55F7B|nr:helicase-related protein [Halarcobacter sp.]